MGCGHSSPSPLVSCTVLKRKSTTRLFTVPKFSEWARTRAGTALHFESFYFRGLPWHLKVYPAGFSGADGAGDFVAVFVHGGYAYADSGTNVLIEILDKRGESVVFDGGTAGSERTLLDERDMGYIRFVERRALEASGCIRDDDGGFTVRCTVYADVEVTKSVADAACLSPAGTTTSRSAPTKTKACISQSLPQYCTSRRMKASTHLFPVTAFSSKWARTPAGHALNFERLSFRGSGWRLMVFPAGLRDGEGDFVAVFVRLAGPRMFLKDIRISIEILDGISGERAVFDHHTARSELTTMERKSISWSGIGSEYRKGYARFVGRKELGNSFTIRCTLSAVDEVVVKRLRTGTSPPAAVSLSRRQGDTKDQHEEALDQSSRHGRAGLDLEHPSKKLRKKDR